MKIIRSSCKFQLLFHKYRPKYSHKRKSVSCLLSKLRDRAFFTGTYGVSATLMSTMFDILNNTIYPFDIPENIIWSIAFEPLPSVITSFGDKKGGNSLGTKPSDGNSFSKHFHPLLAAFCFTYTLMYTFSVMLLSALWQSTDSNPLVYSACETMIAQINTAAKKLDLLQRFQYLNYADPSQDPIGSYGENNVRHLRRMSVKYDPNGVFQKLVPGGFMITGL